MNVSLIMLNKEDFIIVFVNSELTSEEISQHKGDPSCDRMVRIRQNIFLIVVLTVSTPVDRCYYHTYKNWTSRPSEFLG